MNYFKLFQYFCIQVSKEGLIMTNHYDRTFGQVGMIGLKPDFIHLNYVFRVFPADLEMDQCTVNKCSSRVKDVSSSI